MIKVVDVGWFKSVDKNATLEMTDPGTLLRRRMSHKRVKSKSCLFLINTKLSKGSRKL